ncbi:hypothetical protein P7C71_g2756, partial [Lecanoromycetidae sp. Uapishka_2]
MAIRVVARIRPRQSHELGKDVIVSTANYQSDSLQPTLVKVPNPRNEAEDFTFQFSSVYDDTATQQQIFDNEASSRSHAILGIKLAVYSENEVRINKGQHSNSVRPSQDNPPRRSSPLKRPSTSDQPMSSTSRPSKRRSPNRLISKTQSAMSKEAIENIIEEKVNEILATRALDQPSIAPQQEISEEVQRRLEMLEQKIDGKDDGKEQGLTFLLMAKQHAVRGEDASALRMYVLAKDYFPDNEKLNVKIERLREKLQQKKQAEVLKERSNDHHTAMSSNNDVKKKLYRSREEDGDYQAEAADNEEYESDVGFHYKAKTKKPRIRTIRVASAELETEGTQTPRTKELLEIVNTRDIRQIRLLRGVGAKKAEAIIEALCAGEEDEEAGTAIYTLEQLGRLRGVGAKTVENMRIGLQSGLTVE